MEPRTRSKFENSYFRNYEKDVYLQNIKDKYDLNNDAT